MKRGQPYLTQLVTPGQDLRVLEQQWLDSHRSFEPARGFNNVSTACGSRLADTDEKHVSPAVNDPSWEVRLTAAVVQTIKQELVKAAPHETGGVFIGRANFKTRTTHLVDLVLAPPDSYADQICFFRGIQGLPESISEINCASGGQLGYIGEWHTHPAGPEYMSTRDAATVQEFKREFEMLTSPLPVFLLIATPAAVLPFVY